MTHTLRTIGYGVALAAIFALIMTSGGAVQAQQDLAPGLLLSPEQLDDMVAPIALYPDPLISQILVATTYPLEIVEASQWLQRNPNVRGTALAQAALERDWDPSIQALVVFPEVLKYLTEDIAWTTSLGNAFLAQEADVMDAIQRMRDRAAQSGKLQTTPEQQVIRVLEAGQPVYEIIPTNPTIIYVPVYDPYWIWGSAIYYPYPRWYYPQRANHIYFNSGIYIDAYFGSGWHGSFGGPSYSVWNNWGWRPAWNTRTVVVNNVFIDSHYSNVSRPRTLTATTAWSHDATHRRGVVYPASSSYDQYRRDPRDAPRPQRVESRGAPAPVVARNSASTSSRAAETRPESRLATRQESRPIAASQDARPETRPTATRQDARPETRPTAASQDARPETRPIAASQDARPETRPTATRQDARPDARPATATRQDTRVVTRSVAPGASSAPARNDRNDSNFRNDRGNSSSGSSRVSSNAAPVVTRSLPTQAALSRPSTSAPDPDRFRGTAQALPGTRESPAARESNSSIARTQSPGSSRATTVRATAPSVSQVSPSRSSVSTRTTVPEVRTAPAPQQSVSRSQVAQASQASPRQSASDSGGSSEVRRSTQQAAPSSSAQGSVRSSNVGGNSGNSGGNGNANGGGNARGRR